MMGGGVGVGCGVEVANALIISISHHSPCPPTIYSYRIQFPISGDEALLPHRSHCTIPRVGYMLAANDQILLEFVDLGH